MARRATKPNYWASKNGYFVTINGVRHPLASGPENDPDVIRKANEAYHRLQLASLTGELKECDREPCFKVLNAYADWVQKNRAERTAENRVAHLQWFSDSSGPVKCRELTKGHALRHMDARWRQDQHGSRDMCLTTLIACFNWAVEHGLVSKNPFGGMEKPAVGSRAKSKDDYITDEVHAALLAAARPATRDILLALDETGARPGELFQLEAAHYDPERGVLQPPRPKNRRYEGRGRRPRKPRTIYVTAALRPVLDRLAAAHPTGPLFRNNSGRGWNSHGLSYWFWEVRERLGLSARITPNMYRHRFVTRALLAGTPAAKVAQLVDNSIAVIEAHYAHLDVYGADLRAEAERLSALSKAAGGVSTSGPAGRAAG